MSSPSYRNILNYMKPRSADIELTSLYPSKDDFYEVDLSEETNFFNRPSLQLKPALKREKEMRMKYIIYSISLLLIVVGGFIGSMYAEKYYNDESNKDSSKDVAERFRISKLVFMSVMIFLVVLYAYLIIMNLRMERV